MSWIVFAILAAMFWGVSYALSGHLMKSFSMPFLMLASAFGVGTFGVIWGLSGRGFTQDLSVLRRLGPETGFLAASMSVVMIAHCLILVSIKAKNATMAALIEITYPLFTALFIWAFFRETQITPGIVLGAMLIIAGVGCIYYFDKLAP